MQNANHSRNFYRCLSNVCVPRYVLINSDSWEIKFSYLFYRVIIDCQFKLRNWFGVFKEHHKLRAGCIQQELVTMQPMRYFSNLSNNFVFDDHCYIIQSTKIFKGRYKSGVICIHNDIKFRSRLMSLLYVRYIINIKIKFH